MTEDEQEALADELVESASRHRQLAAATTAALTERNRLVLRVIDQAGLSQGDAADLAGISRALVHRILAQTTYDADPPA